GPGAHRGERLSVQLPAVSSAGGGPAADRSRVSSAPASVGESPGGSGAAGPGRQPTGTEISPLPTSMTRPVSSRAPGPSSHATTGATCSGAHGSAAGSGGASPSQPVSRVRAAGATALTVTP